MSLIASLPYVAFKNLVTRLAPITLTKLAMSNDIIFERLVRLASRFESVEFNVNLDKKMVEVNFGDESKNFKILTDEAKVSSLANLAIATTTEGMLNVFTRVKQLFPGTIGTLTINLKTLEEATLSKLENIQCNKLIVSGIPRKLNKKRVAQVIGTIKVTQECLIDSDIGIKLIPTPPTEQLNINYATGITGKDLLEIAGTTKTMDLSESELEANDINAFIRQWLNGSDTTTRFVNIGRTDEEDWILHQVVKGIPTLEQGTVQRDQSFIITRTATGEPLTAVILTNGIDVQRSDGLLATVASAGPKLFFCVWHERNELGDFISGLTEKSVRAQEKCAQLAELAEGMEQRILENIGRITSTQKQIEKMEGKCEESNTALTYFLRYLKADLKDFEADTLRIQDELAKNALETEKAKEEAEKIIAKLGKFVVLM